MYACEANTFEFLSKLGDNCSKNNKGSLVTKKRIEFSASDECDVSLPPGKTKTSPLDHSIISSLFSDEPLPSKT